VLTFRQGFVEVARVMPVAGATMPVDGLIPLQKSVGH